MKKILIVLLMGLTFGVARAADLNDVAAMDYAVYFENTKAAAGSTFSIRIKQKSQMRSAGFQTDIYLPEGMTVTKRKVVYADEDCELMASGRMLDGRSVYRLIYSDLGGSGCVLPAGIDASVVELTIDAKTMTPGLYPIVLKNTEIASATGVAGSAQHPEEITCMVELGNFDFRARTDISDFTVDVSACPNAMIFAKEGQVTNTRNVVIDGICADFVLTDKVPFVTEESFTATKASYSRAVSGAGYYSIVLPFIVENLPENVTVQRFKEYCDGGEAVVFTKMDGMEPNVPYILNCEGDAKVIEIEASDVHIDATPDALTDGYYVGTYERLSSGTADSPGVTFGQYALKADGSGFARIGEYVAVTPFRAYLQKHEAYNARSIVRLVDDSITGISNIQYLTPNTQHLTPNTQGVFSINGTKMPSSVLPKGLYIVDGKKVLR